MRDAAYTLANQRELEQAGTAQANSGSIDFSKYRPSYGA